MIKGTYRVYKNGLLVAEAPNLITTRGRALILRYLAGNVGSFGGAIAVGSAATAATAADKKLAFEYSRGPVVLSAVDHINSQIIFKASVPTNIAGSMYEMGLFPFLRQTESEYFGQLFLGFENGVDEMSGGAVDTTAYRIGAHSYSVTAAASGTATATVANARANFGGYGPADTFSLAYFINNAFVSSIRVRLYVDTGNYYQYTFSPGTTTGYRVTEWAKSAFTATGTPSWENINSADFMVTATAGGSTTVQFDGMRVNDTDEYPDYALVSRAVLATPIVKLAGEQMDVEYALEIII